MPPPPHLGGVDSANPRPQKITVISDDAVPFVLPPVIHSNNFLRALEPRGAVVAARVYQGLALLWRT